MPTDTPKPSYPQILELPPNLTPAQFQTLVSDRIRDLNVLLRGVAFNPAVTDLDMASFRIVNLADPTDDLDGVNLRTLKRFAGAKGEAAAGTSTGLDAYAIVFDGTAVGFTQPGEQIPAYVVGRDRSGAPEEAWLYALSAPVAIPLTINFTNNGVPMMARDLVLPIGKNGPVFATSFAVGSLTHGDVIKTIITGGGDSFGVSMALVVKRA